MNHMIESFAGTGKSEPARSSRSRAAWVAGLLFLLCGLSGSFSGTGAAHAGAQAAPRIWTLEFKPGPLRMYVDPIDGKHYHYFTYRVINLTEGDRMFAPTLELFTDKGRLLASGKGVSTQVSKRLMGYLDDPLLENEHQIIGDLKQGKEHAKDGLVAWEAVDLESNQITIFVTGLSNGINRVPHPVTGEDVLLRKTLRLDYSIPGNLTDSAKDDATPDPPSDMERAITLHAKIANGIWIWR